MIASAIREFAVSRSLAWIAAGVFEETVQIWDIYTRQRILELQAAYCSGAANLALAPKGNILVTGLSSRTGKLAAYDVSNGRKLWQQRLVYPSYLRFSSSGEFLTCTTNNQSVVRFDSLSGCAMETFEGVNGLIDGPSNESLLIPVGRAPFRLLAHRSESFIDRYGLALLDAQFSPETVCLSEAKGPVRCISTIGGSNIWTFDPGESSHVVLLHYSSDLDVFFGVLRELKGPGKRYLVRFNNRDGACEKICELNSWQEAFVDQLDRIITSVGEIRQISDGAIVGRLDFPKKEYHSDY